MVRSSTGTAIEIGALTAVLALLAGCQSAVDSSYQSYKSLAAQHQAEAVPVTEQPATVTEEPADVAVAASQAAVSPETPAGLPPETAIDVPVTALAPVNVVSGSSSAELLQVAPGRPGAPTPTADAPPREIQLLVPTRDFRKEGPQGALRVSYDDLDLLKVLNMDPVPLDAVAHFPDWLKSLDGQIIRVRGFMYPTFEASGIERFVLARDNQICCFGRDPKVYDLIEVELKPGVTTDYIQNRPFDVVGRFHIDLAAEKGKLLGLYRLEDARVIDR